MKRALGTTTSSEQCRYAEGSGQCNTFSAPACYTRHLAKAPLHGIATMHGAVGQCNSLRTLSQCKDDARALVLLYNATLY